VGEGLIVSRKNKSKSHTQRSRLVANQELKKAINAGSPESFGVRRRLDFDDEYNLLEDFNELLSDNDDVAEIVKARTSLHVTIMRRRSLDSQLKRGLVAGYEFGKASARIKSDIQSSNIDQMIVEAIEPRIMKRGRAVVLAVRSAELDTEVKQVMKAMAGIGLKGALRNEGFSPHVTLGESKRPFSRLEKNAILKTVSELSILHSSDSKITLSELEFYPDVRH
jgi:hypothetical protein